MCFGRVSETLQKGPSAKLTWVARVTSGKPAERPKLKFEEGRYIDLERFRLLNSGGMRLVV
jgi:hypothetical protein